MNNRQQLVDTVDTVDIVVIAALKDELDFLFAKKEINWGEWIDLNHLSCKIGALSWSDSAQPLKIAATYAEGIGLVDTAILATNAILSWQQKPKLVAMIGICGGLKKSSIHFGDIVVPELTYLYQFGSYENGQIKSRLKTAEVNRQTKLITRMKNILNETKLKKIHKSAWDLRFNGEMNVPDPKDSNLKIHFGPMGAADLVVKDDQKIEEAKEVEEKVVAVDMESYAVLRTANDFGIDAIVIKSVSDLCGGKNDDFRKYAKFTATEAFYLLVKDLARGNYFERYEEILQQQLAVKDQRITQLEELFKTLLKGATGVDYTKLHDHLAAGEWKAADQETADRMLEVANRVKVNDKWLRQEDIDNFPCEDLRTIDQLWVHYSNGHFGFSVQKNIYIGLGGKRDDDQINHDQIWKEFKERVGWADFPNKFSFPEYDNTSVIVDRDKGFLPCAGRVVCTSTWGGLRILYFRVQTCRL